MEAELLAKGGTPGDGRSDHRRTAKDTRALYDEDPDKITVGNFLRAVGLLKTPSKVAPAPEEEEASGTRTGEAVAGMGTLKGVAMFSKLARKVISHRPPVEKKASNPLDDDDW